MYVKIMLFSVIVKRVRADGRTLTGRPPPPAGHINEAVEPFIHLGPMEVLQPTAPPAEDEDEVEGNK